MRARTSVSLADVENYLNGITMSTDDDPDNTEWWNAYRVIQQAEAVAFAAHLHFFALPGSTG